MINAAYNSIGSGYSTVRSPDPRIWALIRRALSGSQSVVCVGAGTGSYEPRSVRTVALEPSVEMIRQRPRDAAPVVQGEAERQPFINSCFDVALAVLTIHHWRNLEAGLKEMLRVAEHVVIFTWDPAARDRFWLTNEYFPEFIKQDLLRFPELSLLSRVLGRKLYVEKVPISHDCNDGFLGAYWRRPEAYLDEEVRRGISSFSQSPDKVVESGLAKLRCDLESGAWLQRHFDLLNKDELDLGYRLVVA